MSSETESSSGNFFFVPTSRGGKLLIYEDYIYRLDRNLSNNTTYYKCRLKSCRARCTLKKESVHTTILHNHEPESEELVRRETRREQKELKRLRRSQNIKLVNRKPRPVSLEETERFGLDLARKLYRLNRSNYNDVKKEILQVVNWHLKTHGESWRYPDNEQVHTTTVKAKPKKPEIDLTKLPGAEQDLSDDAGSNDGSGEAQPVATISVTPDLSSLPGTEQDIPLQQSVYPERPVNVNSNCEALLKGLNENSYYGGVDRTAFRRVHDGFVPSGEYW